MGKLGPAAGIVLVLAITVAYLPDTQRQQIHEQIHDVLGPAVSWCSSQYKGLERHLASLPVASLPNLDSLHRALGKAASSLSHLRNSSTPQREASPSSEPFPTEGVAACRLSGKVCLRVSTCACSTRKHETNHN